ncbi:M23 family metallopeptidase [Maritalea sp.]|uniref:M23 family metallopeptidase n=1 Tax=Maritalea sp. TaxID=2003361 RepID=UPI003EF7F4D3
MRNFGTQNTVRASASFSAIMFRGKFKNAWIYGLVAVLFSANIFLAIALYKSPKIADALSAKSDLQIAAYENRIAHLRTELDRLHSRQFAKSGNINLQLQDLAAQQELLLEQHDYVKSLAQKAKDLGIDVASSSSSALRTSSPATTNVSSTSDIAGVAKNITNMQNESLAALSAIAVSADKRTDLISKELKRAGLLVRAKAATGGPYIPARPDFEPSDHIDAANSAMSALSRLQDAKNVIKSAPIFRPLPYSNKYSSRFGNRRDPFTGKSAFHSGLDFRASNGTKIRSIGVGKVTFAGRKGGYGNAVEVTHPNGLLSRYAHMSKIKVKVGQKVGASSVLGLVGSTGRSTGPHLHLEVRRNDKPVNPERFIVAGNKLSKYLN